MRTHAMIALLTAAACAGPEKIEKLEVKIDYFDGDTTDAPISGIIHLRWRIQNGEHLEILSEPGSIPLHSSTMMQGELDVRTGAEDTTFKLIAFGFDGDVAVKRTRVDVDDELVRVRSFESSAQIAELGSTVTLSWITEGAAETRLFDGGAELYRTTTSTEALQGAHTAVITEREHRFILEVRGMEKADAMELIVKGDAPPRIAALAVRPHTFRAATSAELTWSAVGSTFELVGSGAVESSGAIPVMLTDTTTFTLIARSASVTMARTAIAFAVEDEREPNDSIASAQPLSRSGAFAALENNSDVDVYTISVPPGGVVLVETEDGGGGCAADTAVRLLGLGGEELARDDDGGNPLASGLGGCSRLPAIANLTGGTYAIEVRGGAGPYTLIVQTLAPSCGNAVVETNEACDDGNAIGGDGCSAACAFEPIAAPGRTVIVDIGDHRAPSRTIAIDALGGESITVHTDTGPSCESDLHLALYDEAGRMIGEDAGPGCAAIDPARDAFALGLPAGRYVLAIDNLGGGLGDLVAVHVALTERNP